MASKKFETMKISSSTVVPTTKGVLTSEEAELFELTSLAGVEMEPKVFKILLDLLQMNVAPIAIERMLRSMASASASSATKRQSAPGGQSTPAVSDSRVPPPLPETSTNSSSAKPRGASLGVTHPSTSGRK